MTTSAAGIAGLLAGLALAITILRSWEGRRAARLLERWRAEASDGLARSAEQRSEAVVRGQVAEQVAPLTPEFPWAPEDARFLGRPVDYIVFDGLGEVRSGELARLREIVFVDVKTGRAGLSRSERRIRDCVDAGRVEVVTAAPEGGRTERTVGRGLRP